MKKYCLGIVLTIVLNSSIAEIKNGYAHGVNSARASLEMYHSQQLQDQRMSPQKRKEMKARVNDLVNYVTYYELTQNLLNQLKSVSPEVYHELDTVKDRNGRITDVYIRIIPQEEAPVQAWGVTSIRHTPADPNTCISEYGTRSVSIKVWAVSRALLVLAHEFGHVKYIIPNMAAYKKYHLTNYPPCSTEPNHIGHKADDLSGKSATAFEKRFKENYYSYYMKNGRARTDSPLVLVNKIRKEIFAKMMDTSPLAKL